MVGYGGRPAVSRNPKPRATHARAFNFCNRKIELVPIYGKQCRGQSIRIALDVRPDGFKIELAIETARIFG
jgi:hypothetical protein